MTPPSDSSVLTVILNYKTADMTLRAIEAAVEAMEGIRGGINVVDNDSRDGSYEKIAAAIQEKGWERVRVLRSGRNGGFGAGNNFGMRQGLYDGTVPTYFYIMNSDAFPEPDAIKKLAEYLDDHEQVGMVGSRIEGEDGAFHNTAFRFPTVFSELEGAARTGPISRVLSKYIVPYPELFEPTEVDWLAGASVMMRRQMIEQTGGFDEDYFLYFEETDLFLRARRAGFRAVYLPSSRVMHIGSVSTGMKKWTRVPEYWFDSRLRYFSKNHGVGYAVASTAANLAGTALLNVRELTGYNTARRPDRLFRDMVTHAARSVWRNGLMNRLSPGSAKK